jgi:predicted ArsR family transcriptional regulator
MNTGGRPASYNFGGATFKVCIFFAANPDEELQTFDIADKFDISPMAVRNSLDHAVKQGMLSKSPQVKGSATYRAGPALRQMVGK